MLDKFRILVGVILLIIGFCTQNIWFGLGIIPIIIGVTGWCPMCYFTGKCKINGKK